MKALLVVNPAAGRGRGRADLVRAVRTLRAGGWSLTVRATARRGDATRLAREAVALGRDVVVVAGGDGTVSEVVDALVGTPTALAVLPMGTGNVWAAEISRGRTRGQPRVPSVPAAARALALGRQRAVDVGRCVADGVAPAAERTRHFLLWAGVGFDAQLTRQAERGMTAAVKRYVGNWAYSLPALPVAWTFAGQHVALELDGRHWEGQVLMVHVGNVSRYAGGRVRLVPRARVDDGWFDVVVFRGQGFRQTTRHLLTVLQGRHLQAPLVEYQRARQVVMRGSDLPVQVDGDPIGQLPMTFTVVPGGLRVHVP